MVKPALAATRAVRVLDFLALHPGRAFSLKEISEACSVNAASMLAVTTALVNAGYLVRHPTHKTYTIGQGVLVPSHAALLQNPAIGAARRELTLLAADLEAHCSASVLTGSTMVAVATAASPRRATTSTQVGSRVPFAAPFGTPFAAFGTDHLRATWMGGSSAPHARSLEKALAAVREHGFGVVEERPARVELEQVLQQLSEEPANDDARARIVTLLGQLADALIELDPRRHRPIEVASINAPVFSPQGVVVMVITASTFAGPLPPERIASAGRRMRAAGHAITRSAFGALAAGRPARRGI